MMNIDIGHISGRGPSKKYHTKERKKDPLAFDSGDLKKCTWDQRCTGQVTIVVDDLSCLER